MKAAEMDELIERHIAAEGAGDTAGAVAMYTDDVEHDVVGSPTGPVRGKEAAQGFYEFLTTNIQTETMDPVHTYYGDESCVMEHTWTGTVPGEFLGVPGNGRRITFRMIHIWEFSRRAHEPRERLAGRRSHRRAADRARSRDDLNLT